MEVGGIGGGAPHADALVKLAGSARTWVSPSGFPAGSAGQDSVAGLLEQLSLPQISSLIQGIENARQAISAEPAGDLLAKAVAATHNGDIPRALATLTELVHAHGRAEALPYEPVLAPIRTEVDLLMKRLTSAARTDAKQKIDLAVSRIDSGAHGNAHRVELHPQTVIAAASRLLESGQYANVVLSASMAQAVIEFYGPFPAAGASVRAALKKEMPSRVTSSPFEGLIDLSKRTVARAARMWREAPLLLMLIVWTALGLCIGFLALALRELSLATSLTGIFFDVWGIGFLGLIGFGFYRSIRRLRF